MKKFFFLLLVCFVVIIRADIPRKKQVLIVHSYSQEYSWTKLQHKGFVESLSKLSPFPVDVSVEYLDTKRLKLSDEYQQFFLLYLQEKYKGYFPDAIYVTDDNALKFFLNRQNKLFSQIPIFFSGVNNLSLPSTLDSMRYVGVYETKDIKPNIELIRQFSPQSHDIWIVGDASTTYQSIEEDIKKNILEFSNYTFHFLSSDNIKDITSKLPNTPKSFVLLTTIGGWCDENGMNLTPKESIQRLKQNPHLILCSMEDSYIVGGVVGGFVTSGTEQGAKAAKLMERYFRGEPLQNIRSITKSPNIYMFDNQALIQARLILSEYTARNSLMLHKEKNFFETHQQKILNMLFFFFVLVMIFLIIVYFVSLEKKRQYKELKIQWNTLEGEYSKIHAVLTALEEEFEIGYWEYIPKEEKFLFSQGLLAILKADESIESDRETFFTLIYSYDRNSVKDAFDEVRERLCSKTIIHNIVCEDGALIKVRHTLISFIDDQRENKRIVGMVQVINE